MKRFIVPIVLVLLAGVLFAMYTDPTYQASKKIKGEVVSYDDALTKSQQLRRLRDELIAKRNTFDQASLERLQRMVPDNVDNIRLIIDINGMAARHGLSLTDVELGEFSDSARERDALAVGGSGDTIGSVTLGFSLSATYDELLLFLQDLEHSLRIIDVENLTFDVTTTEENNYDFTVRTYWLH